MLTREQEYCTYVLSTLRHTLISDFYSVLQYWKLLIHPAGTFFEVVRWSWLVRKTFFPGSATRPGRDLG